MRGSIAFCLAIALIAPGAALAAASDQKLGPGMVNPGYEEKPDWFKLSFLDLREDIREAAAQGRRLLVYFYQDGCPYCKRLIEDNWRQREIVERTRKYFDVIAVNIWGDVEVTDLAGRISSEKKLAADLKVQFTPTILMLDETGKAVLRLNGYLPPHRFLAALEFAGGRLESKTTYAEHVAGSRSEPASGRLHEEPGAIAPPYRLAEALARERKPLVVMFEQKVCSACDELHLDILRRDESRALLKRLHVAVVDQQSSAPVQTPDGKDGVVRDWARALKIQYVPTLVFFDAQGREVFRGEGYLKAFHVQSMLDYVASSAYRKEPQFQRFVQERADAQRRAGRTVDLMK